MLQKEQITWLSLGDCNINDELLPVIGQLTNLSRLKLEKNPITAEGIKSLEGLENLESLNLFSTQVGDAALASFQKMKKLEALFLWQSQFTAEAAKKLTEGNPNLEVNLGLSFAQNEAKEAQAE